MMMFPCVPCGRDVELAEKGLTDCLRNLTLERIVERYNQMQTHLKHLCFVFCELQNIWDFCSRFNAVIVQILLFIGLFFSYLKIISLT